MLTQKKKLVYVCRKVVGREHSHTSRSRPAFIPADAAKTLNRLVTRDSIALFFRNDLFPLFSIECVVGEKWEFLNSA